MNNSKYKTYENHGLTCHICGGSKRRDIFKATYPDGKENCICTVCAQEIIETDSIYVTTPCEEWEALQECLMSY